MLRYSRHAVLPALLVLFTAGRCWSQDSNKTYQLTGTVVDSTSGRPIPRALVGLTAWNRTTQNGSRNRAVLTDSQGEFSFDNMPPGTTEVQVMKPGYFRPGQRSALRFNSFPYRVQVGPDTGSVVLKLAPQAVITGTVLGNDEEPLEGAEVTALKSEVTNGRRQLIRVQGAQVDEDGNFRIAGLLAGRYYLAVNSRYRSLRPFGQPLEDPGETYPARVYFPGNSDAANAEPLELTAGQRQQIHFPLKRVPAFKVKGVVVNSGEWKQISYVTLVDQFEAASLFPERFDPASGSFEFRAVPAGTYFLKGTAQTREGRSVSSYRQLTVQSNLTDLRVPIQAFDIPIVVHKDFAHPDNDRRQCTSIEDGKPRVSDCSDYPAAALELHSLDFPQLQFWSDGGPLKTPFSVRDIPPGRYSVQARAIAGGYIQSLRCGGVDLLREPLVVPEDGSAGPIEVSLRDDFASLRIKVRTEKPDQQPMVWIFPDSTLFTESHLALRSSGGSGFYSSPLAPGVYKIFAFDGDQQLDFTNSEELEKYAAQAASVTVGANETSDIVVDLIRVGE